ncbi:biopolymer transport protein ExbD [Hymenobacter luteus]|uniref:Biopolymer transport protein ExbD n=2 Tax=Hymenobacter TaxID=89966 RepID=A0A7W9SZX4_9BACT|nr:MULTISPECIES: hypothetical protein [Hymenobacter]MBB4600767.1 biopolymer transport protein ExbD [Hymenobacter latericoloratus]MBB6059026.1 biopolymer transport protein ExbD [Hymenobacter luteus]
MTHRVSRIELLRPELGLWGGLLLLLSTLFMSSAKFSADLPVVQLPSSIVHCTRGLSEVQIIFSLDAQKRLYMHASTTELQTKAIELLAQQYGLQLSGRQLQQLQQLPYLSSDVRQLPGWLIAPGWKRKKLPDGIPYSAPNDQFTAMLRVANRAALDIHYRRPVICLRLDQRLPASVVMPFLQQIQAQEINHIVLVTESE